MLPESLRNTIQTAYRDWLAAEDFRPRRVQRDMIASIARTLGGLLDDGEVAEPIAVIEAGTGTGKTVAYSLAVLPLAKLMGVKTVIATATTTLQDQLLQRDLPRLLQHTGLECRVALAKGRQRYLCPLRLQRLLSGEPMQDELALGGNPVGRTAMESARNLAASWSIGHWDGDRDHWPEALDDGFWRLLSTDHRGCLGSGCPEMARCCFYQARAQLQEADCIVTNHDLVLSDLALGGGVVLPAPEDALFVFDEGHRLPEKALGHFSASFRFSAALDGLQRLQDDLGELQRNGKGWLSVAAIESARTAHALLPSLVQLLRPLQEDLLIWREQHRQQQDGDGRLRLPQPLPLLLREAAHTLLPLWQQLDKWLSALENGVQAALDSDKATAALEAERWSPRVGAHRGRVDAAVQLWAAYATDEEVGGLPPVRWLGGRRNHSEDDIELVYSPLLAAGRLQAQFWQRCLGAVVVSATLAPAGDFQGFRLRSGVPAEACYQALPSPFDYENSAALIVPAMHSDGGQPAQHTQELIALLPQRLQPEEASLVLFASRQQMLEVLAGLPGDWRERVLCQEDLPRAALLAEHRRRIDAGEGSVIFGLASLAEGVDLPGDYCTHVVIAKLPFPVPDSPLEQALGDWLKEQGRDPFRESVLPETALRLVQACGRLLRSERDTGRITLMDRRVVSRSYGKRLLAALPPYRLVVEPLENRSPQKQRAG